MKTVKLAILALLLALAGTVTLGNATNTAHAQVLTTHNTNVPSRPLPPQGLYESCAPLGESNECLSRLDAMAAGGFKYVVNYTQMYGDADGTIAYLNHARSLGMKVIFAINKSVFWDGTDLRSYYSALAATCDCSDNTSFLRYVLKLVKNHPALWGYYVGDEISTSVHSQWLSYVNTILRTDPHHPRLIVLGSTGPSVNSTFATFADGTEAFGQDYYPLGDSRLPFNGTSRVAAGLQATTHQYGKQMVMVLQAHSYQEYYPPAHCSPYPSCAPYPTADQIRQQRDMVLQNASPQFILWYSYFDIQRSDNPTLRWSNLLAGAFA